MAKKGTVHLRPDILSKIKHLGADNNKPIETNANILLEKALTKKTVEDKFLETFDFLNEENVSEIIDMIFESNELQEIVKSKFEAINKK
jgi:hypothetical protein